MKSTDDGKERFRGSWDLRDLAGCVGSAGSGSMDGRSPNNLCTAMKPAWTSSSGSLPDGFRIHYQIRTVWRMASSLWKTKVAHYLELQLDGPCGEHSRHSSGLMEVGRRRRWFKLEMHPSLWKSAAEARRPSFQRLAVQIVFRSNSRHGIGLKGFAGLRKVLYRTLVAARLERGSGYYDSTCAKKKRSLRFTRRVSCKSQGISRQSRAPA